jgi:hypothetical protein
MLWGYWAIHFWQLMAALFHMPCHPGVTHLRTEKIELDGMHIWSPLIPQLYMRNLRQIYLDLTAIEPSLIESSRVAADFLMRFPNLRSLSLAFGDDRSQNDPADYPRTNLFEHHLRWEHLTTLCVYQIVLSPLRLQQLLRQHSRTLRGLDLVDITIHHGSGDFSGGRRKGALDLNDNISKSDFAP